MHQEHAAHAAPVAEHEVLSHPEVRALPTLCQDALRALLTQVGAITPETARWMRTRRDAAWEAAALAVGEAVQRAGREEAGGAVREAAWDAGAAPSGRWDASGFATGNTCSQAGLACVVVDLVAEDAQVILAPWTDGVLLGAWAEHAPAAEVEVARSLWEEWAGSASSLIAAAAQAVHPGA